MPDHPGKILRQFLDEKGWTQDDLAAVTGYSRQTINGLASGKSRVTPDMAVALAAAFGNRPAEWLQWDAEHQLSLVDADPVAVQNRARLYALAPISDMQKRGWIADNADPDALERELSRFFGSPIADGIRFPAATRRTNVDEDLSPAETAWIFRARQMALAVQVAEFLPGRLDAAAKKLRQLAAYAKEVKRLPDMLAYYGIRFVVVEPLPGAKIDGAAFWTDDTPVIAVSARWDRIDAFWFVVLHEFAHIRNGDGFSADVNLVREEERGLIAVHVASQDAEKKANDYASNLLIPSDEMESFVTRLAPLFSSTRIIQFANKVQMHPGIVVGQLQHRRQIGYSAHRELLVKVRALITETALTDGWGHQISPGVI